MQELEVARDIQHGYLPAEFNEFAKNGFEVFACVHPARQVSGDLYDLLEMAMAGWHSSWGMSPAKECPRRCTWLPCTPSVGTWWPRRRTIETLTRLNNALAADNPTACS